MYDSEENMVKQNINFMVEDWYDKIQELTPKTYFMKLKEKSARSICKHYRNFFVENKTDFDKEDFSNLRSLEKEIQKIVEDQNLGLEGFFVKLSTRSPKDGKPFHSDKILDSYLNSKDKLKFENPEDKFDVSNTLLTNIFFYQEFILKCFSAKEAMNLLVTSQRIFADLNMYLKLSEQNEGSFDLSLVIRAWEPRIDGKNEFRCFVYNNNMVAISQYNYYFKHTIFQDEEYVLKVKRQMYEYFNSKVKEKLFYLKNYVLDLCIFPSSNETVIIELNPYENTTGPSLFNWKNDEVLLFNKNNNEDQLTNVEIRVVKEYYDSFCDFQEAVESEFIADLQSTKNYEQSLAKFEESSCIIF